MGGPYGNLVDPSSEAHNIVYMLFIKINSISTTCILLVI